MNLTTNAYTVGVVASVLLLRWGRAEEVPRAPVVDDVGERMVILKG